MRLLQIFLLGVLLAALWAGAFVSIFIAPMWMRQWADEGATLNALEQWISWFSRLCTRYYWIVLPALLLATIVWVVLAVRSWMAGGEEVTNESARDAIAPRDE